MAAVSGCDRPASVKAAVAPGSADAPRLVHQTDGRELMVINAAQVPGVLITTVEQVPLPDILEAVGQVTFDDRLVSTIISRVSGRLEDIRVSQWDTVRRGQPILSLYSPDFMTAEAEYLEASASARQVGGPGTPADAFGMTANLKNAAVRKLELLGLSPADIAAIKESSPTRWMRAPISGIIVTKLALRGAQVNPGDQLFSLATLDRVWITADIYEDDLARVHAGQSLEAVTAAYPSEVFRGVIDRISPALDPNTHTLQLRCQVSNPGSRLKPMMLARVRIVTRPGAALVVPQEALVFDGDAYFAFVEVSHSTVERRTVGIAAWNERGYARVISGLGRGERVIARKSLQLNALWHAAHGESY
ncbi:MAG: efflux RND transporter periplasmic adaptor subunit [Candidatus Binataceae bacterium]